MVVDREFHTENSEILKDADKFRRQNVLAPWMYATLKDIIGQFLKQNFKDIKRGDKNSR